jgi:hypothetical protein
MINPPELSGLIKTQLDDLSGKTLACFQTPDLAGTTNQLKRFSFTMRCSITGQMPFPDYHWGQYYDHYLYPDFV